MSMTNYISVSCEAAVKAGKLIMEIYQEKELDIRNKADKSPVTRADLESSALICKILKSTGFPVITEETSIPEYQIRKSWNYYWLVDPLDGTKEFIKRNDEFSVNIALIEKNIPALGVIYIPAKQLLYLGIKNTGTWKLTNCISFGSSEQKLLLGNPVKCEPDKQALIIITSRSHLSDKNRTFIYKAENTYNKVNIISSGSSYKLCLLAEGKADVYPRFGPTSEWDTAAGEVIAGNMGILFRTLAGTPLQYNKNDLLNPDFIAYNPQKYYFDNFS